MASASLSLSHSESHYYIKWGRERGEKRERDERASLMEKKNNLLSHPEPSVGYKITRCGCGGMSPTRAGNPENLIHSDAHYSQSTVYYWPLVDESNYIRRTCERVPKGVFLLFYSLPLIENTAAAAAAATLCCVLACRKRDEGAERPDWVFSLHLHFSFICIHAKSRADYWIDRK